MGSEKQKVEMVLLLGVVEKEPRRREAFSA